MKDGMLSPWDQEQYKDLCPYHFYSVLEVLTSTISKEKKKISDWKRGNKTDIIIHLGGFPGGSVVKNLPAIQEMQVWFLSWEDLEKGMATHSSILAWEIPWRDEPDRLQSMGSQRVGLSN